jgi:transglutaminase-like putative cysteine protease
VSDATAQNAAALAAMPRAADLPDPADALGATDVIEPDHPLVAGTAARVAEGATTREEIARRLFEWVRDEVAYDMAPDLPGREAWRASATLERGFGFCQQKAVVLASLLRARGIPAGIAFQDVHDAKIPARYADHFGGRRLVLHGLTALNLDGVWLRVDATLPRVLCERKGYRLVDFASERDCLLPRTDIEGSPHFTLIGDFGIWPDLPHEGVEAVLGLDYLHDPDYRSFVRRHGPPA